MSPILRYIYRHVVSLLGISSTFRQKQTSVVAGAFVSGDLKELAASLQGKGKVTWHLPARHHADACYMTVFILTRKATYYHMK